MSQSASRGAGAGESPAPLPGMGHRAAAKEAVGWTGRLSTGAGRLGEGRLGRDWAGSHRQGGKIGYESG